MGREGLGLEGRVVQDPSKGIWGQTHIWGLLGWGMAGVGADFWEGDATKHFSVKKSFKRVFGETGSDDSVNEGFGKAFYRKGNSVKRSGPFNGPPDCEK